MAPNAATVTRVAAVKAARAALPDAERAMIDAQVKALCDGARGLGEITALEVLAAVGVVLSRERSG